MKVIDLKKRTIYVDDIQQIYIETNYNPEKYNVQTTYGTYLIDREDYFKVKDYLLSLNDEVEIIEEDKKIEKVHECFISTDNKEIQFLIDNINQLGNKVNEIIDKINEDK